MMLLGSPVLGMAPLTALPLDSSSCVPGSLPWFEVLLRAATERLKRSRFLGTSHDENLFVHQTGVLSAIALGALACSRADHDDPCFHEDSSPLLVRLLTSYEVMVVVVTWVFLLP